MAVRANFRKLILVPPAGSVLLLPLKVKVGASFLPRNGQKEALFGSDCWVSALRVAEVSLFIGTSDDDEVKHSDNDACLRAPGRRECCSWKAETKCRELVDSTSKKIMC
jgi:hypothetical protein